MSQNLENNSNERPINPAWYLRPWFWSIIILLLLLSLLIWIFYKQWQANLKLEAAHNMSLQAQLSENAILESEITRLRAMLQEDPCIIKELLAKESNNSTTLIQKDPNSPSINKSDKASKSHGLVPQDNESQNNIKLNQDHTEAEAPPPPPLNNINKDADNANPPILNEDEANKTTRQSTLPLASSLEQATVLIINEGSRGINTGTGFFIAPGIILTNAHVATGQNDNIFVIGKFKELVTEAKLLAASSSQGRDYAILQVPINNIKPLSFNLDVARTQRISAWGFPGAVTEIDPNFRALLKGQAISPPEVVYSEGSVSVVQEQSPPIIFHTAVVSHGNSGGPLVNERGEVVGINTYISMDDKSYRQSSIAIVSRDIINFLQEHNIPFTLAAKE